MTCIMNQDRLIDGELFTSRKEQFNKPLHRAVLSFACAVRRMIDLTEIPSPDEGTEYHIAEFLPEMETLLVEQLVCSLSDHEERKAILHVAGLDYLEMRLDQRARQLEE